MNCAAPEAAAAVSGEQIGAVQGTWCIILYDVRPSNVYIPLPFLEGRRTRRCARFVVFTSTFHASLRTQSTCRDQFTGYHHCHSTIVRHSLRWTPLASGATHQPRGFPAARSLARFRVSRVLWLSFNLICANNKPMMLFRCWWMVPTTWYEMKVWCIDLWRTTARPSDENENVFVRVTLQFAVLRVLALRTNARCVSK